MRRDRPMGIRLASRSPAAFWVPTVLADDRACAPLGARVAAAAHPLPFAWGSGEYDGTNASAGIVAKGPYRSPNETLPAQTVGSSVPSRRRRDPPVFRIFLTSITAVP